MRIGRVLSIAVVSLASVIVVVAVIVAFTVFGVSFGRSRQNFSPLEGQAAASPVGDAILFSQNRGDSSFLYRRTSSTRPSVRLTSVAAGIESEPSFSHNGTLVVYSFAESATSKSAVWVVGADGSYPHAITGEGEDALHPVFSPDDTTIFYAASRFTGNHSPVARPARHDWDIFSASVNTGDLASSAAAKQITHSAFYDMQSLDVAADGMTPGGLKLLISTRDYPIGPLFREFNLGSTGKEKIFQPHVPGEFSSGPAFGGSALHPSRHGCAFCSREQCFRKQLRL